MGAQIRTIAIIAGHDLRMALNDRAALVWLFVLPIVFATFTGLVMGGSEQSPVDAKARLTVVNQDQGFLGQALVAELTSAKLKLVELAPEEKDSTPDKLRTLVIPSDFTAKISQHQQVTLRLEKDPDSNMRAAMMAEVRIVAAISRLIGSCIEIAQSGQQLSSEAFATSQPGADLVRVETRFAGVATVVPSGFSQSIPGNLVMFVMLVALTFGAASLSSERSNGLLRRLLTTPVFRWQLILGKILGRFVIAAVQLTLLVAVGWVAQQTLAIDIGDNVLALYVILLVYALVVAPLGVLFGAWFRQPEQAANMGVLATLVMAALGGCWWPIEVVSEPLQRLALVFPTGWAMTALHQVISFGRGLGDVEVTRSLLVLLAFGIAFTVAAARALRVD